LLNIIPDIDNSLSKSLKPRIVARRDATRPLALTIKIIGALRSLEIFAVLD